MERLLDSPERVRDGAAKVDRPLRRAMLVITPKAHSCKLRKFAAAPVDVASSRDCSIHHRVRSAAKDDANGQTGLQSFAQFIIESARQEPAHPKHVDGGAESTITQAVFALAETTRAMIHRNLNQPISRTFHQRGDETMHAVKWNQCLTTFRPHRFERATGIADAIACEAAPDEVRDAARQLF